MTPYEIDVLLWYSARCEDHPDMIRNPPVWRPTVDQFKALDLLVLASKEMSRGTCYELTDRGRVYVEALQAVPLPRPTWKVDWPRDSGDIGRS